MALSISTKWQINNFNQKRAIGLVEMCDGQILKKEDAL